MKKVFSSNQACIHAYAQRNQSEGRANSIFFYGDKCYSYGYHYLLAEFVENEQGEVAIYINNKRYSSSTDKHIGLMIGATRQYKQLFSRECDDDLVESQMNDLFNSLTKARKPDIYRQEAAYLYEKYTAYCDWKCKAINPEIAYIHNNIVGEHSTALIAEARKPDKYIGESAYLWKQYVEYCIFMGHDMNAEVEIMYSRVCGANADAYAKQYIEEEKRKKAQRLLDAKEQLDKFFNYEVNNVYGLSEDYCRISLDGSVVRTTQGCEVPVSDAKVLWSLIKAGRDIKGLRVGSYTVIGLNGHLKIGCHHINVNNMKEIGLKLEEL